MHIVDQSGYEPRCCSSTESQHVRVTGRVRRRVMMQACHRYGKPGRHKVEVWDEMTLEHGTAHSSPVKGLEKGFYFFCFFKLHLSLLVHVAAPPPLHTHTARSVTCFLHPVVASVHVRSLLQHRTSLWSKACNVSFGQQHHTSYYAVHIIS